MTEPTEDVPYNIDEFATEDEPTNTPDVDQANKPILEQVSAELEKDIVDNNSFTVLDLPVNATPDQKAATFDQIAIHKGLALHLQKYKVMIDNKVKELK